MKNKGPQTGGSVTFWRVWDADGPWSYCARHDYRHPHAIPWLEFAILPVAPDTAARIAKANDWDTIRRDTERYRRPTIIVESGIERTVREIIATATASATASALAIPAFLRRAA